jgi:transketolase
MDKLEQRVREISKRLGLSHVGSCISALPVLDNIYKYMYPDDIVLLDGAHAHLAHLVIREKYGECVDPEQDILQYGIHCDIRSGCDASGGSLGHGIGIGIGMAIARPKNTVFVIVTDGSMQEGSNWEALRIAKTLKLDNLSINCNFNGYTATDKVDGPDLLYKMRQFYGNVNAFYTSNGKGMDGVQGHYKKL